MVGGWGSWLGDHLGWGVEEGSWSDETEIGGRNQAGKAKMSVLGWDAEEGMGVLGWAAGKEMGVLGWDGREKMGMLVWDGGEEMNVSD